MVKATRTSPRLTNKHLVNINNNSYNTKLNLQRDKQQEYRQNPAVACSKNEREKKRYHAKSAFAKDQVQNKQVANNRKLKAQRVRDISEYCEQNGVTQLPFYLSSPHEHIQPNLVRDGFTTGSFSHYIIHLVSIFYFVIILY